MPGKNEIAHNRSVPYNTEAEMYVLGSILIDNTLADSVKGRLFDDSFYDEKNQKIYHAILNLHEDHKDIEILSVIEELKRMNVEGADEYRDYLVEVMDSVPSTASSEIYINIVRDNAVERTLLHTMQDMSDDILNHKYDLNDTLDHVEDTVLKIIRQRRSSEFISLGDAAATVYEKINSYAGKNKTLTGLDTGYPELNKVTLGLQKGDLMILAARPAVGKSAYAMNLALQVSRNNVDAEGRPANVAFFSLEMSIEQLLMRIYAYEANVALNKIRSGALGKDELMLLSLAKENLKKSNLYFDENVSNNFADIRLKCRQLKQKGTLDFVVIDYLQLITSSGFKGSRQEEVSQISRQLKTLAKELEVPILALSQLSRSIEGRSGLDKKPQLSDLRESGSIEQDADMVIFLYNRKDIEGEAKEDEIADELNENVKALSGQKKLNEYEDPNYMKEIALYLAKNRQGAQADIDYHFYGAYSRMTEQRMFRPLAAKSRKSSGMKDLK